MQAKNLPLLLVLVEKMFQDLCFQYYTDLATYLIIIVKFHIKLHIYLPIQTCGVNDVLGLNKQIAKAIWGI